MYHLPACSKPVNEVRRGFSNLSSDTAMREVVKEQIRIRVVGFGWRDLHVPCHRMVKIFLLSICVII